jgi:outer membrane protein TolC
MVLVNRINMLTPLSLRACGLWLVVMTLGVAGCQSYEPRPLDLEGHVARWHARNVDIEPVAEYARRILEFDRNGSGRPASAPPVLGSEFDATDGLNLHEAQAVALYFNPQLRAARLEAKVPLVGAMEAGRWDDPQLGLSVLSILDKGTGDRFKLQPPMLEGLTAGGLDIKPAGIRKVEGDREEDPWIVGVGLDLTIPLSGRLAVQKRKAWAEYELAWRKVAIQEWALLERLCARWAQWSAKQKRIDLIKQYLELLDQVLRTAEQLARTGELRPVDARVLSIEQAVRRSGMIALQADMENDRLELLAMLGLEPSAPFELTPDLRVPEVEVGPEDRSAALLATHPRVLAARARYQAAEEHLHLEIRKQYPDLSIGPKYGFEDGLSRLGLGLGVPLPLWNRNRQAIAEAFAARDVAQAQAELVYEEAAGRLARLEARLAAVRRHRVTLEQDVAPLVDRQIQETRGLIELGEVDVLLLRDALQDSLEAKLALVEVTLSEALLASELNSILQPRWMVQGELEEEKP